jgi:hypothetical protein
MGLCLCAGYMAQKPLARQADTDTDVKWAAHSIVGLNHNEALANSPLDLPYAAPGQREGKLCGGHPHTAS